MDLQEINKNIDTVLEALGKIKDSLDHEYVLVSLDRKTFSTKIEKNDYMLNVFKEARKNNNTTVRLFIGTDDPLNIKGYKFETNDKYNTSDFYKFYFSIDVPITEESIKFFLDFDSSFVNNLPDDTLVKVYTTTEMNYLTLTKGDFEDYKNLNWNTRNHTGIIKPYFECKDILKKYE